MQIGNEKNIVVQKKVGHYWVEAYDKLYSFGMYIDIK